MANSITDPPFASDPPVKLNVDAKVLGLVLGIIAVVLAVIDLIGMLGAFTLCGGFVRGCGFPILWVLGSIVVLVADVMVAVGGFRMYQGDRSGKNLVIYGIVVAVIAQVVNLIGTIIAYSGLAGLGLGIGAGAIIGFIFWLVIRFIVYYLVVISRFPGEAPLVSSPGGYGAPPPPPPPPPM
ncbi:MAG: hypothetical protein E6I33_02120 [Chloroflexi bacterium]|nr:MAG: hypothetical protein E6I55_09625 [Chloroflexota bacterium]TMF17357.1 MAG: hypothetical protein E6I33_02120 [Chloroflexota bacterium]